MYYEYWGLKKPPFDNVPDPSMYVDCHRSMENAIDETLFAIEEGNECIAVIVGDVGLGKTLSIRMIVDALNEEKYQIALITNPGISFAQMLQEIIGQLTETECLENDKLKLLEVFNHLLHATKEAGKKVLIFIDEANAITPVNLENLRLLTNMQDQSRNLFTMVLAGQNEFARRLEHPKRANFFQRIGSYSRIDKLESVGHVTTYVTTRLELAGAQRPVFDESAYEKIWEHSDHGIPRLINKLCKLCLKSAEENQLSLIGAQWVDQIGSRLGKLTGPVVQTRKPRKRPHFSPATDIKDVIDIPCAKIDHDYNNQIVVSRRDGQIVPMRSQYHPFPMTDYHLLDTIRQPQVNRHKTIFLISDGQSENLNKNLILLSAIRQYDHKTAEMLFRIQDNEASEPDLGKNDDEDEMHFGDLKIKISIPDHYIAQSRSSTPEQRYRIAGTIAAEALKRNPQLTRSYSADPVPIWQEIRDFVLQQFGREKVI
ncbi:MAG: AAA family ATPase [Deltaproteobacteria bacterium]|nr:AAA family ATPase [Deltaproteobacteria bacterium]